MGEARGIRRDSWSSIDVDPARGVTVELKTITEQLSTARYGVQKPVGALVGQRR